MKIFNCVLIGPAPSYRFTLNDKISTPGQMPEYRDIVEMTNYLKMYDVQYNLYCVDPEIACYDYPGKCEVRENASSRLYST